MARSVDWPGELALANLPDEIRERIEARVGQGCPSDQSPAKRPSRKRAPIKRAELIAEAKRRGKWLSCTFCGGALTPITATLEHLTPLCRGGTWDRSNLALACFDCNHAKGSMTAGEFRAAKRL